MRLVFLSKWVFVVAAVLLLPILARAEESANEVEFAPRGASFFSRPHNIVARDSIAVASFQYGIHVINIADSTSPQFVSELALPNPQGGDFLGTYYVAACRNEGLFVVDLANPAAPAVAAILGGFDDATDADVSGQYAFVTNGSAGLAVVDITNPLSPITIGSMYTGGYANDVCISGSFAYVAGCGGLQMLNITSPGSPTLAGSYSSAICISQVDVVGTKAYLASGGDGLEIIDVSNPPTLTRIGQYAPPSTDIVKLDAEGLRCYITRYSGAISAIDVSNSASPVLLGTNPNGGAIVARGNLVMTAVSSSGLHILDFTNPAVPLGLAVADYSFWNADVIIDGTSAFISSDKFLRIVDISNPDTPLEVSRVNVAAQDAVKSGNLVYVASAGSLGCGIDVVDVGTPSSPAVIGHAAGPCSYGISYRNDTCWVASGYDGLTIYDVSNPASPVYIGGVDTPGYAQGIRIAGNYAYLSDFNFGLQIIDFSNPLAPTITGNFDPIHAIVGVESFGHYLALGGEFGGFYIIDVSSQVSPVLVCQLSGFPGNGVDIVSSGDYLYVSGGFYGGDVEIVNIRNPLEPIYCGRFLTGSDAYGIAVSGGRIFVADGEGFQIADATFNAAPDTWGFANSGPNMWPASHWQQFNYCSSPTPCQQKCFRCESDDFPDWDLFAMSIGSENAYFDSTSGNEKYRPSAVAQWNAIKGDWSGSCFGFAASDILFGEGMLDINSIFPGHSSLASVSLTGASRDFVNRFSILQFGQQQQQQIASSVQSIDPNTTLDQCINMINAGNMNGRVLMLFNQSGPGAHAVIPHEYLRTDYWNWWIYVQDANDPSNGFHAIRVDTEHNTWSYLPLPGWGGNAGLILTDPVNTYALTADLGDATNQSIRFYHTQADSVLISSAAGQIGHNGNNEFNTVTGAHAIVPFDGKTTSPLGYFLPSGEWFWEGTGIIDGSFYVVDGKKRVFRSGGAKSGIISAQYSQASRNLTLYGGTSKMASLDTMDLEVIAIEPDSEIVVSVNNIEISQTDSIRYGLVDGALAVLQNFGDSADYDVRIEIVNSSTDTVFYHVGIPITANTTHLLTGDWRSNDDSLTILIDHGNNGSYDDTLSVVNTPEPHYTCGDADGNTLVTISDVVHLINYIFAGGPAPSPVLAGDADCNGIVTISDAVYLINYIFAGGAPPCAACK